jgi:hypothetical protein
MPAFVLNVLAHPVVLFGIILAAVVLAVGCLIGKWKTEDDTETTKMRLAAGILLGIGVIFAFSMVMFYWQWEQETAGGSLAGKDIFERCADILPPIATAIIGFYFGGLSRAKSNGGQDKSK